MIYGLGNTPNKLKSGSIVILSGDYDWDTTLRTLKGVEMKKKYKKLNLIICGKYKSSLMLNTIRKAGVDKIIIQNKSTNTFEDALFIKEMSEGKNIFPLILVTSSPHMMRSYHTFQRVFPNKVIYKSPTNDLLNLYSPFLPTGILAVIVNIIKDWKYNGKFV